MEIHLAFALILAVKLIHGVHSTVFTIKNNCPYNIAPATQAWGDDSVSTGFELASGASKNLDIPKSWIGQVWARFECSNHGGRFRCNSGDCGTDKVECGGLGYPYPLAPVSQIVFVIGHKPDGKDTYGLNLFDGFNLPVSIVPQGDCEKIDCAADINVKCPPELAVKDGSGKTIGCKGACLAFKKPKYCCKGDSDDKCVPTHYSRFFKKLCPQSLTYPNDNSTISYTCNTGTNYAITFCP